jgi:hypothetical protein
MLQEDMKANIFEPIIKDIIGLIKEQISLARNGVSAILLVGGFGQSKYLKSRVQAAISSSIQVLKPENGWTAVVRGAAMIGLGRTSASLSRVGILSRIARKHYGTELVSHYNPSQHDSSKR